MKPMEHDPDIRQGVFRLDEQLTLQQIRFVGGKLRELIRRYETSSRDERQKPIDWPEWHAFIDAAYACGFVCGDAGEEMGDEMKTPVSEKIKTLKRSPTGLEQLSLRDLRRVVHYIMRSERWGDGGCDTGGGAVWDLITSRLGDALASRLGA
jgi:hypothetical protein